MNIEQEAQPLLYHLHDEAGTLALGAALARVLQPGLSIHLHGTLGAGKTALTRALLHAAGHAGRVKSPTYTLVEPYQLQLGEADGAATTLFHFDLYRMNDPEEFNDAGFRDHFDGRSICIVEWPEKGAELLPAADIAIFIAVSDAHEGHAREVELRALSDKGRQCLARLKFAPNM